MYNIRILKCYRKGLEMPSFLIKNLPAELHERLRRRAADHHRSMNRELIAILERNLAPWAAPGLPPPVELKKPVDPEWIVSAIREARESRP